MCMGDSKLPTVQGDSDGSRHVQGGGTTCNYCFDGSGSERSGHAQRAGFCPLDRPMRAGALGQCLSSGLPRACPRIGGYSSSPAPSPLSLPLG